MTHFYKFVGIILMFIKYAKALIFWICAWVYTAYKTISIVLEVTRNKRRLSQLELSRRAHKIACTWGHGIIRWTPGWRYSIHGRQYLPKESDPAVIIVANHQSAADICALFTTYVQFRWLSKDVVFRFPWVGKAMKYSGYVPVKRGDQASHKKALETSAQWLKQNISMVFFPEGTRSKDGTIQKFKSGAFRLSVTTGAAIQPVVIYGTHEMMAKHSIIPKKADVTISVLPKMSIKEDENLDAFIDRARNGICKEYERLHRINCNQDQVSVMAKPKPIGN
jgi:1-acyl-sn-glycerol-3-phosphate acyltransferase